jgi:hypothetical protein
VSQIGWSSVRAPDRSGARIRDKTVRCEKAGGRSSSSRVPMERHILRRILPELHWYADSWSTSWRDRPDCDRSLSIVAAPYPTNETMSCTEMPNGAHARSPSGQCLKCPANSRSQDLRRDGYWSLGGCLRKVVLRYIHTHSLPIEIKDAPRRRKRVHLVYPIPVVRR